MTAVDEENSVDSGEWGVYVAAAVQDIRREIGEAAANRVATSLHRQRAEVMEAADGELRTTQEQLERTRSEVDEAQRAHARLQADLARMEAAVRDAKAEAARIRSEAIDLSAQRAELDALRRSVEAERIEAQRIVDEAIATIDTVERDRDEATPDDAADAEVLDLRDDPIDLRAATLDEREAELAEWEAELVAKAHQIERRDGETISVVPPPRENPAGWGRRTRSSR